MCIRDSTRSDRSWRYEISNDVADSAPESTGGGSGLDGLARRAAEAGGDLVARREGETFTVVVTVPAEEVPAERVPAEGEVAG